MTEEIKVEDLHNELKGAAVEPKFFSKMHKLTAKLLNKVNGRINAERDIVRKKLNKASETMQENISDFIASTNDDLSRFKKRYEALYSDLVRRVLLKMENRVFSVELFEQATLDLLVEKMYRLEKGLTADEELDHIDFHAYIEDCAAKHEKLMQKHADAFAKKHSGDQGNVEKEETSTEDSSR